MHPRTARDLGACARTAATLSAALGGARVTVDSAMTAAEAAALADEIRGGLDAGTAGGGPRWKVDSLTIEGTPPRIGAIKITVAGTGPLPNPVPAPAGD